MRIAAAQIKPIAGDIAKNIVAHCSLIERAVAQHSDLIFFPELSLAGYEPHLAKDLAMDQHDSRLSLFQELSDAHRIIIGIGLPLIAVYGIHIGMIFFQPDQPRASYSKQQLHSDELPFFVAGDQQLLLKANGHTLAPAICYESLQPSHSDHAALAGADIYLASVAKSANGVVKAFAHYPAIAKQHSLTVLMANSVGPSDNFISAGRSAIWNCRGELVAQLDADQTGLVMIDTID